jgi:imidazolonepropionase-like amidohydrolase
MKLIGSTGLALALALGLGAQAPKPGSMLVKAGTLIYSLAAPPMPGGEVLIVKGRVSAVGRHLAAPAGVPTLDYAGMTVMPELLDAHTHLGTTLPGAGRGDVPSDALAGVLAARDVAYAQDAGVAAMRVLGTAGFIDVAAAQAVDAGVIRGPHIVPAAHPITIPGGHGDFFTLPPSMPLASYYTPLNGFVNSPADVEEAVHLQIKYGAKVIKIFASGGVLSPLDLYTSEQLTYAEMRTAVEVAHNNGLKVAAHDENIKAILDALHAGVDSIEHGSDLNMEAVDYMKVHHQWLDATLYVVDNILQNGARMHMPAYSLRKARDLSVRHFASFSLALRNGVMMAAGSDQAYAPGVGTIYNEVVSEVNHGATPGQALTDATLHNAELMGLPQLGGLEVGQEGDLVAMRGDPLRDIHAVSHLIGVVYQGRVIRGPEAH